LKIRAENLEKNTQPIDFALYLQLIGCLKNIVKMRRDVFQAIADPTRRAILSLLVLQAMTPNAIAEHFASSRQAVSKHIKILAECELVKQKQSGREIYYHFNPQKMKEVDKWLEPFRANWENRFNQLDNVLKNLKTKNHE
jgi:DNA-binding transcriptional ArsR family regulator